MRPVNFHAVEAGFPCPLGGIGELDDDPFNLRDGQWLGRGIHMLPPRKHQMDVFPGQRGGAERVFPSRGFGVVVGSGVTDLEEYGAAVLVDRFAQFGQRGDVSILGNRCLPYLGAHGKIDVGMVDNDQADAALGEILVEVHVLLGNVTLFVHETESLPRLDHPIPQSHLLQLHRLEQFAKLGDT